MGSLEQGRRTFLTGLAGACGASAGAAFGYLGHDEVKAWGSGSKPRTSDEFSSNALAIRQRQALQSRELVAQLKLKHAAPVFGKVRVWEMIERLGMIIDPSDEDLVLTSQYIHIQQILEGMERDGVNDPNFFLIALLHDLGKVVLTEEAPEYVVGFTAPIGQFPLASGLDNVVVQFGHDEMIYMRLKDYVPDQVAWAIRYHSASPGGMQPYMNQQDQRWYDQYLAHFTPYDLGMKSTRHVPQLNMAKYRALIEDTFPKPILF
jgi:hypothetical protein